MRPDGHHQIIALGEIVLEAAKGLAEAALDPVPGHGRSGASRDCEPQPRMRELVGDRVNHQRPLVLADPPVVNGLELPDVNQPPPSRKTITKKAMSHEP